MRRKHARFALPGAPGVDHVLTMGINIHETEPTIRRLELGEELKALRKAAKLTLEQASRHIGVSPSKLCRIEGGRRTAAPDEIGGLLAIYTTDSTKRKAVLALASNCGERGWWQRNVPDFAERQRTLVTLESRADRIVNVETMTVPGLLQTGDYTRALLLESDMVPEDEIEDRMVTRLRRHSVLMRQRPPTLLTIIDELVLHRTVGGPDVTARQLLHLVRAAQKPHITIRVVPKDRAHAGIMGAFALIGQPARSPVVFVEQPTSGLFVEDRAEVEVYGGIVEKLLNAALDQAQSVELIASLAKRRATGASSDATDQPRDPELAQEHI
jgi:transcriptional regulator with XRE-family HTH domain